MDRRISIPKPQFTPEETQKLNQSFLDRVQSKFQAAVDGFTGVLNQGGHDDYKTIWLTN